MINEFALALLFGVFLVTSFVCTGLLALWAAASRWHWLPRVAVVLAVLSPLLFIPAYEPWSLFAIEVCTVAAGITVWRWRAAPRREGGKAEDGGAKRRFPIQFSIRTLLALTCLVAMLTPILVPLVKNTEASTQAWVVTALGGVCSGSAVLIGAWLVTTKHKWLAWPAAALLCAGLAAIVARFDVFFLAVLLSSSWSRVALVWFAVLSMLAAMTWLLLRLWFASGATPVGTFGSMLRMAARTAFCLLLVALALPPAYVAWELNHPLPVPNLPVPQPNGIDDIVAAGTALATSPILSTTVEPKSTEELAAEVAKYAGDYSRLRLGLTREIRATIWAVDGKVDRAAVFSLGPANVRQAVREAARALMREAQLAHQQGRYTDAARIALDNVRLGQAVARESLLVDYLTGAAVEDIGNESLYQVLPQLNADDCRETVAALAEIERRREPVEDALYRERVCSENLIGWTGHFLDLPTRLASADHRRLMLGLRDRQQAKTRLLIAELALRACQLERGTLPDQLEPLVPEFLAELPIDPFDPEGRPLRYVRTAGGHVLYSVGCDGKDDGGRPPARNPSGGYELEADGDLQLDVFFPRDEEEDTPSNE